MHIKFNRERIAGVCRNLATLGGFAVILSFKVTAAIITFSDLHPDGVFENSVVNGMKGGQQVGFGDFRALLWAGTASSFVNLHPVGASSSVAYGTSGAQQVGVATIGGELHGALWSGTASSFVDLNPTGVTNSFAYATDGTHQAGTTRVPGNVYDRAALWTGNANSFVDLHPAGAVSSTAYAVVSDQVPAPYQAGWARIGGIPRAVLWFGTATSFRDLHPTNAQSSYIRAASGAKQAGGAGFGLRVHAALWTGTSGSFQDLHPAGATDSEVLAMCGEFQAGWARIGGYEDHAALWTGTPSSFLDLHTVLGTNYTDSIFKAVWKDGGNIHVAGYASKRSSGWRAILWKLVPAPQLFMAGAQRLDGNNVVTLTWTNVDIPIVLEGSGAISSGWNTVSSPRSTNENTVSATVTNAAPTQFYRLRSN